MSSKLNCIGFKAHSINPNRCRRCFKDVSEHVDSDGAGAAAASSIRTRRSSASDADASTKNNDMSSNQSVSFTLKPKRVKFSDLESTPEPEPVEASFTVCVKPPPRPSEPKTTNEDYQSRIKELSHELAKSKERIDILETKNKELESMRKTFGKVESKEGIKQSFDENIKLKQKLEDLEQTVRVLRSEKKSFEEKSKWNNNKRTVESGGGGGSGTSELQELRTKLAQSEKLVAQLTQENDDIKKDVKELEIEFQELHDNFREDQSSEFRVIKRELEAMSKNCRVMQFKLKKADRTIQQLETEKLEMQKELSEMTETAQMDVDKKKMKILENELAIAKEVSLKLHAEIETLKEERMLALDQLQDLQREKEKTSKGGSGFDHGRSIAKLSPSPSLDQSNKDYEQVVRDLYDTMEREKDLQEQLRFSEEETRTMRKKLSTMEQENEILMMQIRKMASKNNNNKEDDDDEEEELNPEEMKLHLELYEQEMIVLRRKTDELEQENENFQQEIKYLQEKLVSQPLTKMEIPEIPVGSPPNVIYDHKIRILETEARDLRKKLVDKEKENESLRTEVELHRRRTSKVLNRSRSLDAESQSLDMKKQLQLFEQEANILRQKLIALEGENEKLSSENKRLQLRVSKKPPPGPVDQLQLENMELKDKIRDLERKCDSLKTDLMNAKLNESTETETDFITNLKKQLRAKEGDLNNQSAKIAKMDIELAKMNREYKKLKDSLAPRRRVNRVIRETATRLELKEIIKEMEDEVEELQINIRGKDAVIENLSEDISELKQELEQKPSTSAAAAGSAVATAELDELKRKLEEEQHRSRSLQNKLDKFTKDKSVDLNSLDTIDALQSEKKELAIQLEDMALDLQKAKSRTEDLESKLALFTNNNSDISSVNNKLRASMEKAEDEIEELKSKVKTNEKRESEWNKKCEETKRELERVQNHNLQLKKEVEESRAKLTAINSRSDDVSENTALLNNECKDLKRKLDESRKKVDLLERQSTKDKQDFAEKEKRMRDELSEKIDTASKKVRREVHIELQSLREECTTYKNRCTDLMSKLEKAEKEVKELNEKIKSNHTAARKERDEFQDRIETLENQVKTEQRKREKLEREVDNATRGKEQELLQAQDKIVQLEREHRRHQAKLDDMEYDCNNRVSIAERELNKIRQDYDDLTNKYELLEKDFVDIKSRSVTEKEALVEAVSSLKKSYEDKLSEIKTLKESSMSQRKEWYKEKLAYQERIANFESRLNKANLVEEERNRLKVLIAEKENLLNSYRKEERTRNEERERNRIKTEQMQNKLDELEKAERNMKFMNITGRAQVDKELQDYRIRLEHSETSHKGELAALHAEYDGRMRLLGEEVEHMQQQIGLMAQERDRYREQLEKVTKEFTNKGTFRGTLRDEIEDLNSQLRILRSDLEGALLENRNLRIQHGTERSTWQIQIAEYKSKINQLEERSLLETRGTTRNYARTKMELAWDKERQEHQRLLQETQKFIQELRDKLIGTDSLREKEREESRKQLADIKSNMDREHVSTQQKISELQFDLLALKEAHARLKSQNERLRRERSAFEKARIDFVNEEMVELQKILDSHQPPKTGTAAAAAAETKSIVRVNKKADAITESISGLQKRLKTRLDELMAESAARGVSSSDISIVSRLNGRLAGSNNSLSSTNLPLPSAIKRAPPRIRLNKKSISLDHHLADSRGASQERIWDSDQSINTTPNSSVSNLRFPVRYGYAGYESDSSTSSFFQPNRLRSEFTKEGSFGGSESDTSAISATVPEKKSLKERFKIKRSKTDMVADDSLLKQKLGLELSPLELAKQREKKEKSLRYKISKTLSKTFSRSITTLPETPEESSRSANSKSRNKSPTRTKSPTRSSQEEKQKTEQSSSRVIRTSIPLSSLSGLAPTSGSEVPGLAQLRQRPTISNLAVPPSRRSPPKIRLRTETNV